MEYSRDKIKIGAVVVLCNPQQQLVNDCLKALYPQVDKLCVVDNSDNSNSHLLPQGMPDILYVPLFGNKGIAYAQNVGIKHFIEERFDFILFSDQDSVSPPSVVDQLARAYFDLSETTTISGIGPLPINRQTGSPYLYKENVIEKKTLSNKDYYKTFSIISSYSLIPTANFKTVGLMDENLFIDFVENEWFWRAHAKSNLSSVLAGDIKISHELGKSKKMLGRTISISSPFRIYFQTRNLLWLSRISYIPHWWKKKNLTKLVVKLIYYSLFADHRWSYVKRMTKGLYDGLTIKYSSLYENKTHN